MKKIKTPVDYYDFFQEIPKADYLKTDYLADIEIQDEYETASDSVAGGLSDEQVSQLAVDSLDEAKRTNPHSQPDDTRTPPLPTN